MVVPIFLLILSKEIVFCWFSLIGCNVVVLIFEVATFSDVAGYFYGVANLI